MHRIGANVEQAALGLSGGRDPNCIGHQNALTSAGESRAGRNSFLPSLNNGSGRQLDPSKVFRRYYHKDQHSSYRKHLLTLPRRTTGGRCKIERYSAVIFLRLGIPQLHISGMNVIIKLMKGRIVTIAALTVVVLIIIARPTSTSTNVESEIGERRARDPIVVPRLPNPDPPNQAKQPVESIQLPAPSAAVSPPLALDPAVIELAGRLRGQFNLAYSDHISLKENSGNHYLFNLYSEEGGGGFWAVATLDGFGKHTVVSGQDYPTCDAANLSSVPLDLLPYCFSGSDDPQLINRYSGTLASP